MVKSTEIVTKGICNETQASHIYKLYELFYISTAYKPSNGIKHRNLEKN